MPKISDSTDCPEWQVPAQWITAISGAVLLLVLGFWHIYGRALIQRMYQGNFQTLFIVPPHIRKAHSPEELYTWMATVLLLTSILMVVAFAVVRFTTAWTTSNRKLGYLNWVIWIGLCSVLCCAVQRSQGYNSHWYPIEKALNFTADPPYVHRVLFVFVAKLARVATGWPPLRCFWISQFVAVCLAMTAIVWWAAVFVQKKVAFFAPMLLLVMLAPTFTYLTFYDIGIVCFYALGLSLLLRGHVGWYLLLIAVATLNHENILFLILLSAGLRHGTRHRLAFVTGQLAIYAAVRTILFHLIPVSRAWAQGNVWINIEYILFRRLELAQTAVLLLCFVVAIYFAWKLGPGALRWCTFLLPLLLGTTILVGQLNEARQFDAFIPVAVVLILKAVDLHARFEPAVLALTDRQVTALGN